VTRSRAARSTPIDAFVRPLEEALWTLVHAWPLASFMHLNTRRPLTLTDEAAV
jgi:hypothetical protein